MPESATENAALPLVREAWEHMKRHRPIAAMASWRAAIRVSPGDPAAQQALDILLKSTDLPEVARVEPKLLATQDDARRSALEARIGRIRPAEMSLETLGQAYADLADADPVDGRARFNEGLCLAWQGRNVEAISAIDRAMKGLVAGDFEVATRAWTLTEILRQGGGAEDLADDLNHILVIRWTPGDDPAAFLDDRPDVLTTRDPAIPGAFHEWLDGPTGGVRRVRAHALRTADSLRLHGLDPVALEGALEEIARIAGGRIAGVYRESKPLPLTLLDQAIWASVRLPIGVDADSAARMHREVVERYYEGPWLRRPRLGLDGRSPIEAGQAAVDGDKVAMAKLSAVVRVREQLGARPSTAHLYQGYPFDRLRRRLGLPPTDPDAVDPADPTCMAPRDLDGLDVANLTDFALADAYESAATLGDDSRAARFASALADRGGEAMGRLDASGLFAVLVRDALAIDDVDRALGHVDRAQAIDPASRRTYETWRAELLARLGRPESAVVVYRNLIDEAPDPALALDAAETLLDNGHDEAARELAGIALEARRGSGRRWSSPIARRACSDVRRD